jgi:hypothetical protein
MESLHSLTFRGVSRTDLTTFAGLTLVLTAVALATSYIQALCAMRLHPVTSLGMTSWHCNYIRGDDEEPLVPARRQKLEAASSARM